MKLDMLDQLQAAMMQPGWVRRGDSLSVFAENELKQVIAKTYDKKYPELDARQHVPIETGISPGAMSWAYDSFEIVGEAKWLGPNPTDVPSVDVGKKRHTFPVEPFGIGYDYTVQELMSAQYAGVPLTTKKADTARRQAASFEHTKILFGEANLNIPGLYTNQAVPIIGVPNGDWFGAATADQLIEDVTFVIDAPYLGSALIHKVNTVLFPPAYLRKLQTTRIPDTNEAVIDFLKRVHPDVREWREQRDLATAGTGGGPRILAYQKEPDMVSSVIPMPYTMLDPQMMGFVVRTPGWQLFGGTVFFYPASARYAEGMG